MTDEQLDALNRQELRLQAIERGDHLRPPGGEQYDSPVYEQFGLTADHVCRMWARYVDQTNPPPQHIANLIAGVTADVLRAVAQASARANSRANAVRIERQSTPIKGGSE